MDNKTLPISEVFLTYLGKKTHDLSSEEFLNNFSSYPTLYSLQQKLGYTFKNKKLLLEALTHSSFAHEFNIFSLCDYERLEFLDSLVNLMMGEAVYKWLSDVSEGELSKARMTLVNASFLSRMSNELGMSDCILVGKGELKNGTHYGETILADSLEALIAAIYCDSSFEKAKEIVTSIFGITNKKNLLNDFTEAILKEDPKSQLQEITMSRYKSMPEYCAKKIRDHQLEIFEVSLYLEGQFVGRLRDPSKKRAEKKLAQMAIDQKLYHL